MKNIVLLSPLSLFPTPRCGVFCHNVKNHPIRPDTRHVWMAIKSYIHVFIFVMWATLQVSCRCLSQDSLAFALLRHEAPRILRWVLLPSAAKKGITLLSFAFDSHVPCNSYILRCLDFENGLRFRCHVAAYHGILLPSLRYGMKPPWS